jgi:hypothetical protein
MIQGSTQNRDAPRSYVERSDGETNDKQAVDGWQARFQIGRRRSAGMNPTGYNPWALGVLMVLFEQPYCAV